MVFFRRSNNRQVLNFILLVICFCCLLFTYDGVFTIKSTFGSSLDLPNFLVISSISLMAFSLYALFAHKTYKLKINYPILFVSISMLLVDIFGLSFFKGVYDTGEIMYSLNEVKRFEFIFLSFLFSFGFYSIFGIGPQCVNGKRFGRLIAWILILIASSMLIYSLIAEFDLYVGFFSNGMVDAYFAPQSYTSNRNTYGFYLLLGFLACYYLFEGDKRIWWWIPILVLLIAQAITMSKTPLIIQTAFVVFAIVRFLIKSFKKHLVTSILLMAFLLVLLIAALVLGKNSFPILLSASKKTIDDRFVIWNSTMDMLDDNPLGWTFGVGTHNFDFALRYQLFGNDGADSFATVDSGYYQIIGSQGILGLIIYVAFVIYVIYLLIKAKKAKFPYLVPTVLLLLASILHGLTESTNLLMFTTRCSLLNIFALVPLMSDLLHKKEDVSSNPNKIINIDHFTLSLLAGTLIFSILIGIGGDIASFGSPIMIASGICMFVSLPFSISFLIKSIRDKKRYDIIVSATLLGLSTSAYAAGGLINAASLYLGITTIILCVAMMVFAYLGKMATNDFIKVFLPYLIPFVLLVIIDSLCSSLLVHYWYFVPMVTLFDMLFYFWVILFISPLLKNEYIQYSFDLAENRIYLLIDKIETIFIGEHHYEK